MNLESGATVVITSPGPPPIQMATPSSRVAVLPIVGLRGPAGAAGGSFTHVQVAPAATWTIEHNLGRYPAFVLFLDDDPTVPVITDIKYPDDNTTVVEWPEPASGRAEA